MDCRGQQLLNNRDHRPETRDHCMCSPEQYHSDGGGLNHKWKSCTSIILKKCIDKELPEIE